MCHQSGHVTSAVGSRDLLGEVWSTQPLLLLTYRRVSDGQVHPLRVVTPEVVVVAAHGLATAVDLEADKDASHDHQAEDHPAEEAAEAEAATPGLRRAGGRSGRRRAVGGGLRGAGRGGVRGAGGGSVRGVSGGVRGSSGGSIWGVSGGVRSSSGGRIWGVSSGVRGSRGGGLRGVSGGLRGVSGGLGRISGGWEQGCTGRWLHCRRRRFAFRHVDDGMAALGAGTGAFGRVAAGHVLALGADEPVAGGVGDALGAAQRQTRVILLSNCGFWGRETQKQEQCTCHKVNMHSCNLEGSQQVLKK